MRYAVFMPLLAVSLLLSGCGSTTSPAGNQSTGQPAARPAAERPIKEPVTILVSIKNNRFLPQVITAQVGDTIKWVNEDSAAHTVTGGDFNSPRLAKGETYQLILTKPETVNYACSVHPDMKGQVIIKAQ